MRILLSFDLFDWLIEKCWICFVVITLVVVTILSVFIVQGYYWLTSDYMKEYIIMAVVGMVIIISVFAGIIIKAWVEVWRYNKEDELES